MENIVAVVSENNVPQLKKIVENLRKCNVNLIITTKIIEGFNLYLIKKPLLMILDDENKGFTIAKTIFDIKNRSQVITYMLIDKSNISSNDNVIGIDFFVLKPINSDFIEMQIKSYLKKYLKQKVSCEIERAEQQQMSKLPNIVDNKYLTIDYLYSPFNKLSGDYIKIFEDSNCFYGVVFDCAGHDLLAWQQTGIVEMTFNYAIKFLRQKIISSLSEMMTEVNKNLVTEEIFVAAVMFKVDPVKKKMTYVSAGLPSFFLKDTTGDFKEIMLQGKIIGYGIDTEYAEQECDLKNVKEIIFASDGFSDMFVSKEDKKADDVSALFIRMK